MVELDFEVTLGSDKYTCRFLTDGSIYMLRNGEPWWDHNASRDVLIHCLAQRIHDLEQQFNRLGIPPRED
jgi:hypothetical protein